MKWGIIIGAVLAVVAGLFYFGQQGGTGQSAETAALPEGALAEVSLPASLTQEEQMGERAFAAVCADCHGTNAQGQDGVAPPLVHKIYEPSHHGDMAFLLAAKNGVRAHHWKFGNMPPVAGVTQSDVTNIVAYVRALQRANGIE
ncbi:Cytochrome C oxidase, cbb3-type, subunit III [Sulfitobacter brevis]|uniref:Cytochrome C oxidase, cbb3-type, subunit III n=1 Tax=Sulfitobacter brevis TaxID=74348 RepID=A0A1I1YJW7_9RHOB|nr:cytochrome c [Sulfitobacter brevis]SFE18300.1 Cytochrome C oxidase, cbb3-type, subunit III [Sulfitobacter brevis]